MQGFRKICGDYTQRIKMKGQMTVFCSIFVIQFQFLYTVVHSFRLVCSDIFPYFSNRQLWRHTFLAHMRGPPKCGAHVRPNIFEHSLTRPWTRELSDSRHCTKSMWQLNCSRTTEACTSHQQNNEVFLHAKSQQMTLSHTAQQNPLH